MVSSRGVLCVAEVSAPLLRTAEAGRYGSGVIVCSSSAIGPVLQISLLLGVFTECFWMCYRYSLREHKLFSLCFGIYTYTSRHSELLRTVTLPEEVRKQNFVMWISVSHRWNFIIGSYGIRYPRNDQKRILPKMKYGRIGSRLCFNHWILCCVLKLSINLLKLRCSVTLCKIHTRADWGSLCSSVSLFVGSFSPSVRKEFRMSEFAFGWQTM
jgi:hypothetical protein